MYTVVRFCGGESDSDLVKAGEELNLLIPSAFDGLDHVPHQFSFSVSTSEQGWVQHRQAMIDFLTKLGRHIRRWRECGIDIGFDVMLDWLDYGKARYVYSTLLDRELLAKLHEVGVELELSFYLDPGEPDAEPPAHHRRPAHPTQS